MSIIGTNVTEHRAADRGATRTYPFHFESTRLVAAAADVVFTYLDDHTRLSAHMSKSSWMMAGSRMHIEVDAAQGKNIGSHITLRGRALGIPVYVEEVVTERTPPLRKIWETIGTPHLLVIGHYRMGYDVSPRGDTTLVRVFIDYQRSAELLPHILGTLFGIIYARWCIESMTKDAARHFTPRKSG